jgi:hypothetical protein
MYYQYRKGFSKSRIPMQIHVFSPGLYCDASVNVHRPEEGEDIEYTGN